MTMTLGSTPTTSRRQPVALSVLVGTAVVVGWVLYRHYAYPHLLDRVLQREVVSARFWLLNLIGLLLLSVPYALALLLWGRGLRRGVTAAAVAVATGLFFWGWTQVFQNYVFDNGSTSHTSVQVFVWGLLLGVATLVPLAWGLARRIGRTWMAGVLVGPLVAFALREVQLRWDWWQERVIDHWQLEAVVFVTPFVLAVLACWALEQRSEMGSSAASKEAQTRRSRG